MDTSLDEYTDAVALAEEMMNRSHTLNNDPGDGAVIIDASGTATPGTRFEASTYTTSRSGLATAMATAIHEGNTSPEHVIIATEQDRYNPVDNLETLAEFVDTVPVTVVTPDSQQQYRFTQKDAGLCTTYDISPTDRAAAIPLWDTVQPLQTASIEEDDYAAELLQHAEEAKRNAYRPYSGYSVGVALLTDDGHVFVGSNNEREKKTGTIHGEETALGKALAAGATDYTALALSTDATKHIPTPCKQCAHMLDDYTPSDLDIITQGDRDELYARGIFTDIYPSFDQDGALLDSLESGTEDPSPD